MLSEFQLSDGGFAFCYADIWCESIRIGCPRASAPSILWGSLSGHSKSFTRAGGVCLYDSGTSQSAHCCGEFHEFWQLQDRPNRQKRSAPRPARHLLHQALLFLSILFPLCPPNAITPNKSRMCFRRRRPSRQGVRSISGLHFEMRELTAMTPGGRESGMAGRE